MFTFNKIKDSKLEKIFEIKCIKAKIVEKYNQEVIEVSKKADIQGFRKGHVPTKFVEEKYGKSIQYNVFEKLVQESINEIIKQNNYRLASQPDLDFDETSLFDLKNDFDAKITFSIFPEVPEINLSNIVINTYKITATQDDVENSFLMFKKQNATNVKVDRASKNGDVVKINSVGYVDDVAFDGGNLKEHLLELGSKSFIDTFEDQLVGKKAGDKLDVLVNFPAEYHAENLAGKPAKFVTEVVEVLEKQEPEINEEFLKSKTKSTTIDEFKIELKENIEKYYNAFVRDNIKGNIFDMIAASLDFDVPQKTLQNLIDNTVKSELEYNDRQDESKKKNESEIIEKAAAESKKRIMLSLYIQDIASKQNIQSSENDIFSFVMDESARTGSNPMEILNFYNQNDQSGNTLKELIKEKKVYEYIFDKITKNFEEVSRSKMEELTKSEDFKFIK